MKKLLYAGLFCAVAGAGALALATPIEAKGGSGGHGPGGHGVFRSGARWQPGPFTHWQPGPFNGRRFAHHRHRHHHRYFAGGWWGWGYPYGYASDVDYPDYADAPPPPPRIAEPVIRTVENSKDVCTTQPVTVRATGGGETTVNVIRC